jgi:S1-C subfamily serine protease
MVPDVGARLSSRPIGHLASDDPGGPHVLRDNRRGCRALALAIVASLLGAACSDDGADGPVAERAAEAGTVTTTTGAPDDGAQDDGGGDGGTTEEAAEDERDAEDDERQVRAFAGIPDIVEEVEPSVVTVVTDSGLGSGVVYDADGLIVTNHHVVAGSRDITVVFADQARVPATLLASTPLLDLAILDADRDGVPPATFADELPRVGELAIAMGSPLGLEQTVTAGIVSGVNRSVPGSASTTQALVNLIQTDAAISPGNSGGALVDGRGRVIGINVAYLPPAAGAVSLGFAIPAPQVHDAVEDLLATGQVQLPYIGVVPAQLTPQIAERFGLEDARGFLVADLEPGGPAAQAGMEPGDLVTSIGDEETPSVEAFLGALRRREPGETVPVQLLRDGDERTVQVTLVDRPRS